MATLFLHSMTTHSIAPPPRRAPSRSRGFGLVQVLLLIAVMAGLSAIGYMQWRERSAVDSSRQERQALSQADRALIAYATVVGSLPCPDIDRDGVQDCAAGNQSGWLPTVTLRLAGADAGVDVGQLRYMVQRQGGANDLTLPNDDSWRPLQYDDAGLTFFAMRETTGADAYPANIVTLTDLCQRLDTGSTTTLTTTMAQLNAPTRRATAYALAHPGNGDANGDGNLFDGANTGADPNLLEDPNRRPLLATYNDLVLERSYASLLSAFHCRPLIDSINTVALAHDVTLGVAEMRRDNIEAATRALAFATLAAAMTALEITLTVLEGTSDAGNAAVEWVICAASLGLAVNACAAAPQHTVAIGLAGGVVAANLVAVGLNVTAAVMAGNALAMADASIDPSTIKCPEMDASLKQRMLDSAQAAVTDAVAKRVEWENKLATERNNLILANAAKVAAVTALVNALRNGGTIVGTAIGTNITALGVAADDWALKSFNLEAAQSRVDQATRERDMWAAEVTKYNAMLADSAGTITRLTNEIAALDVQINAIPAPPNKTDLENQRAGKNAELQLARDTTGLTAVRNKAVVSRDAAQGLLTTSIAARNTAQSAFNTAQATYSASITTLLTSVGRFAVVDAGSPAPPARFVCTTACQLGDTNVSAAFNAAMVDLFGPLVFVAGSAPNTDYKYLKPTKIQRLIDAYEVALTNARTAETEAKKQQTQIQNMVNNPGACNITGKGVTPMTPAQADAILVEVDRKGGTR